METRRQATRYAQSQVLHHDRLFLRAARSRGGKAIHSLSVNGLDFGTARTIRTDALTAGRCVVDVVGAAHGVERRLQFLASVIAPLRLAGSDPVVTTNESRRGPRAGLSLRLVNQSHGDQHAYLEIISAPSDWVAEVVGDPFRLLAPGKGASVRVTAEYRGPQDRPAKADLLPFTIRANPTGDKSAAAESTFYVRTNDSSKRLPKK
jgi:hypothetical protein